MHFAILIYLVTFKNSPHVLLAEISTGFSLGSAHECT